jgi:predicted transcriptional regulator
MVERRSKTEQYVSVLRACHKEPLIITHIMYKADVNMCILQNILLDLYDNGLILKISGLKASLVGYKTSDKGIKVLEAYDYFINLLNPVHTLPHEISMLKPTWIIHKKRVNNV